MANTYGERDAARVERAVGAFIDRIQQLPPGLLTRTPGPGEWSIMELAAHSAEIYGYWAKQLTYLQANPGRPFGRTVTDPARIRFVEEHKHDSVERLTAAIHQGASEATGALRSFSDDAWAAVTGVHPSRGEMTMAAFSELFLAGHAEEHLKQLDETLTYEAGQLDRAVVAKDQIRTIIRSFKERLFTDIFPGRTEVPKTL
ncbi:MAG: hypothetical protein GEU73_17615, partial [Chloroflexi bacterium]|nr:hypothetical protein [Chloroflexota bacterium]